MSYSGTLLHTPSQSSDYESVSKVVPWGRQLAVVHAAVVVVTGCRRDHTLLVNNSSALEGNIKERLYFSSRHVRREFKSVLEMAWWGIWLLRTWSVARLLEWRRWIRCLHCYTRSWSEWILSDSSKMILRLLTTKWFRVLFLKHGVFDTSRQSGFNP